MPKLLFRLPAFAAREMSPSRKDVFLRYLGSMLIFGLAIGLRFWLDDYMPPGFPYLTFFPAVVISAFVFGVGPGSLVAVLAGLCSWYFFIPPFFTFDMSGGTMIAMGLYVFVVVTDLALIFLMNRAFNAEMQARRETQRLADQQEVMAQELDHRLKNLFATANAVIGLSLKHVSSAKELAAQLRLRFDAMARSNLMLRGLRAGEETTLQAVISQALEPFGIEKAGRLQFSGVPVVIDSQTVLTLSLVFHELATNAAKYGSISTAEGRVQVEWRVDRDTGEPPHLLLNWTEIAGPAVTPDSLPSGGFGSHLIQRVIGAMGGSVETAYPASGAVIDIRLPLAQAQTAS